MSVRVWHLTDLTTKGTLNTNPKLVGLSYHPLQCKIWKVSTFCKARRRIPTRITNPFLADCSSKSVALIGTTTMTRERVPSLSSKKAHLRCSVSRSDVEAIVREGDLSYCRHQCGSSFGLPYAVQGSAGNLDRLVGSQYWSDRGFLSKNSFWFGLRKLLLNLDLIMDWDGIS